MNIFLATEDTEKIIKMKSNKNIINGNCWVAYFDILGFTGKVKELRNHPDTLARIYYQRILEKIKRSGVYLERVNTHWFSDSFIFYTNDDSPASFTNICPLAEGFITNAIWQRKPLRGALSFGRFCADKAKNIFIGIALIDAHDYAEKQDWIGCVMTPNALKKINSFKLPNITGDVPTVEYYVPVKNKDKEQDGVVLQYSFEKLRAFRLDASLVRERVNEMYNAARGNGKSDYILRKYINTLNFLSNNTITSVNSVSSVAK